jgi:hypothetical protein
MNINKIKMNTLYHSILGVFIGGLLINIFRSLSIILKINSIEFVYPNLINDINSIFLVCVLTPILEEIKYRYWLKKPNKISFIYVYSLVLFILGVLMIFSKVFNVNILPIFATLYNFDTIIPGTNNITPHWTSTFRVYIAGILITLFAFPILRYFKLNLDWVSRITNKYLWFFILFSSLVFTFTHDIVFLQINDIPVLLIIATLTVAGIIFSIFRVRIGLLSAVMLHMIWNFNVFFVRTLRVINNNNILIALILFIIVSLLLYFLYRVMKNKNFDLPK